MAAAVSAAVSAGVAWFTSRRAFAAELGKLKLGVQQKLLEQMVTIRSASYPEMYALLSDLPKAARGDASKYSTPGDLLDKVNLWDSKHSIFLGPRTTNICYAFRQELRQFAKDYPRLTAGSTVDPSVESRVRTLLQRAARLELGMRSDLGIYGVEVHGKTLSLRLPDVDEYEPLGTAQP
jgi:hypothetical protein